MLVKTFQTDPQHLDYQNLIYHGTLDEKHFCTVVSQELHQTALILLFSLNLPQYQKMVFSLTDFHKTIFVPKV